ncbi:MAG: response regulator transcription factor [Crocosphaera sp.]|nr:response regulator transcription factor [Crocosphaera sp.]
MVIRILLVDDEKLIRRGLKALLTLETTLDIVGEANDGKTAIYQAETLQPDVILMDVRMPEMNGVIATKEICQRFPQIKVLILTTFDTDEYVTQALRHGAAGYLLKDTPSEELAQAIQAVHKGYTQLGPGIGQKVSQQLIISTAKPPPELEQLTPREKEILQLIAKGSNNREIAQELYISEKTVKNHVTNILNRLNVRDRTQAAILANGGGCGVSG